MFPTSQFVFRFAKIWQTRQRDVLSPDLFTHGSRCSTRRSDLLKLPIEKMAATSLRIRSASVKDLNKVLNDQ